MKIYIYIYKLIYVIRPLKNGQELLNDPFHVTTKSDSVGHGFCKTVDSIIIYYKNKKEDVVGKKVIFSVLCFGWFFYTGVNGLRCNADVCGQIMTVILPIIPTSAPGRNININININKANLGGFRTINISHRWYHTAAAAHSQCMEKRVQ